MAFFRDDFASVSLGALMNALGAEPAGVLIPSYLAAEKGLSVGDRLSMIVDVLDVTYMRNLAVVGLYDHFPTVYPDELPVLVVNLEYIFHRHLDLFAAYLLVMGFSGDQFYMNYVYG